MTKKITLATLKSFVKKNPNGLYINVRSRFNGMTDGVESVGNQFMQTEVKPDINEAHTLGIPGAWLVGSSRDYFNYFENDNFVGIDVSNCCGHFIVATKK